MADISLEGVRRVHPDGTAALDGIDLAVADREVLGVIGPSGSGKSTLLRVIAGLEPLAAGRVRIGGRDVSALPTRERDVALVSQHRTLYRFLDVGGQVAFPLQLADLPEAAVAGRAEEQRRAFGLGRIWRRRPSQLSAGGAQRTALARAAVRRPAVLLLDEPLQLLDPPTQVRIRAELARLQRQAPTTTISTTNDHGAVLGTADRVAVLRAGRIVQVAPPGVLLARPASRWVAGFVGEPAMTFVDAVVVDEGGLGYLRIGDQLLRVPGGLPGPLRARVGDVVGVGARPDQVRAARPGDAVDEVLEVVVADARPLGPHDHAAVDLPTGRWVARFPAGSRLRAGERVAVHVAARRVACFDAEGRPVWHGDPPG